MKLQIENRIPAAVYAVRSGIVELRVRRMERAKCAPDFLRLKQL